MSCGLQTLGPRVVVSSFSSVSTLSSLWQLADDEVLGRREVPGARGRRQVGGRAGAVVSLRLRAPHLGRAELGIRGGRKMLGNSINFK